MAGRISRWKFRAVLAATAAGWLALESARADVENQVHPGFDLIRFRPSSFEPRVTGMDFLSGNRMVISTWRPNEVYILSPTDGPPEKMIARKAASGFKEVMGLCVVHDTVFLADQDKLYALVDKDGDGLPETKQAVADIPFSGSMHEWSFGLVYKGGKFYTAFSVATTGMGTTLVPQKENRRGVLIELAPGKPAEVYASGLRGPDGLGLGVDSEFFATDNQGSWLPASKFMHVQAGHGYGHRTQPEGLFEAGFPTPLAVWLPYGSVTRSPTQPIYMRAGRYAGQYFYGDIASGAVRRVYLEKVAGEYQGCVMRFSGGFEAAVHRMVASPDGSIYLGELGNGDIQDWGWQGKRFGLQRLKPNGNPAFEIDSVRIRKSGFELFFSEPIEESGIRPGGFSARQWWYEPTAAYGGPEKNNSNVPIRAVRAAPNRIFVKLDGMRPQQVLHMHLDGIKSKSGRALWTPDFWYTMNAFSDQEFRP